tara:strand:+ start:1484 stop:2299 length:816 start_codon:yes stop_codon:yes gene_type:complete
MKKFAVIGHPIDHSLSDKLFNYIFKKLNINAKYIKIKVEEEYLADFLKKINNKKLCGLNVTSPHKNKIINYIDDIDKTAQLINSVNVIENVNSKLKGYNTDWVGFCMSLQKNSIVIKNKEIVVLGYGGASRSIIYCLIKMGVKKISVLTRNSNKIKELEDFNIHLFPIDSAESIVKNNSIVINATPIGMKINQSPLDYGLIHKNQILIDIIYTPYQSPLIKFGSEIGSNTINGLDMFIYQALYTFKIWFGDKYLKQLRFSEIRKFLIEKIN